jgi:hypothetical protein
MTSVFIGMGYTLGALSAIYDRQSHTNSTFVAPSRRMAATLAATEEPAQAIGHTNFNPEVTPPSIHASGPTTDSFISEDSSLWKWLTRERHFRNAK